MSRRVVWRVVQGVGGLALGLGLLAWFVSDLDFVALRAVLSRVSVGWVLVAAALMLFDYFLQGWRWGFLLRHVDKDVSLWTLWESTAVMWSFNTLLPLRAGNVIRPALVARRRNLPFTTVLFTTIADYLCDMFGVLILVLVTVLALPPSMLEQPAFAEMKQWGIWLAFIGLCGFFFVVLLSTRRAKLLVLRLVRPFPRPVRNRVIGSFEQLVAGMAAVGDPMRFAQALGATLLVWGTWWLAILAILRAFSVDLPLAGSLFLETALTLSMLVPQAPGFLGVFQVVTEEALALFGAPAAEGQGIAVVYWAVCFVPVTVYGLFVAWKEGLGLTTAAQDALPDDVASDPR
jgi:hypothetical protein